MVYNLHKESDCVRIVEKVKTFISKGYAVELKRIPQRKSINQNSYFHLIISWFAFEYGEDSEYVKQEIVKKIVCPEVFKTEFVNQKTGEIREDWKSFSILSKEETTYVIDKFRHYSSKEAGIYLPEPSDLTAILEMEVQLKNNETWL